MWKTVLLNFHEGSRSLGIYSTVGETVDEVNRENLWGLVGEGVCMYVYACESVLCLYFVVRSGEGSWFCFVRGREDFCGRLGETYRCTLSSMCDCSNRLVKTFTSLSGQRSLGTFSVLSVGYQSLFQREVTDARRKTLTS